MENIIDLDTGVRVVVRPHQSSYFAGEPFSVTVTFSNTRSADRAPAPATPQKHQHKRNAHSISSAPISRPPTSPGTPRTPRQQMIPPAVVVRDTPNGVPTRRGLIGRTPQSPVPEQSAPDSLPALVEQRRKKMLAKSLSVSIAPLDLDVLPAPKSAGQLEREKSPISPPPQIPAVISRRSDVLALGASHPHARKHSVMDGVVQPQLEVVNGPSPLSPSTSALDPIAESSSSPKSRPPPPPSPRRTHASTRSVSYPHSYNNPGIGLGLPGSPRIPFATAPNSELLLYAYVALSGRVVLAPVGKSEPALPALRNALLRPRTRGGGSLTLQASSSVSPVPSTATRRHQRSSSFSAGLRALGTGIGLLRSTSSDSEISAGGGGGGGWAGNDDPETPLPTLDVPPEMLGVDVRLAPGEERSYTYTIALPAHLPPTFRGRTMRFSYELVVGVCRASGGSKTDAGISRIMKVPIRVYSHVSVTRPPRPYDLLWPVARRIPSDEGVPKPTVRENAVSKTPRLPGALKSSESVADLERYAERLGTDEENVDGGAEPVFIEEGTSGLTGCREAVEVMTRNLKKVSYDITKDGVTVAVLTFPKSAFRLGETVNGVVEINWREGRGRVLQLTALLEAHEALPTCLAPPPSNAGTARYLRRVHAEHHARFVLGTLRLGFSLDIPSDGSPAFNIISSPAPSPDGISPFLAPNSTPGGLEWKVRLCLLVGVADAEADTGTEGVQFKGLVRDGTRDESGGRGVGAWGNSWRAPERLVVMQRVPPPPVSPVSPLQKSGSSNSWTAFLSASLLGTSDEPEYHDGDAFTDDGEHENESTTTTTHTNTSRSNPDLTEEDKAPYDGVKSNPAGGVGVGVRYGGKDDSWGDVKVEMVECVVPLSVWAGNTAFRAGDVVFDV
ncbi:hypothetical protein HMN09_01075100 [Mycena chlorophos]|uniref:Rgp1-domain-containing protein n=1 Tax=Mycena chlorophos TaxID=658473 RepID=A0A8H6SCZ6_MYCCL|nr:hypothetical protein HMN09_01075100 [Mycena chlorophos]